MAFYNDEEEEGLAESDQPVLVGPVSSTIEGQGVTSSNAAEKTPDKPGNFVGIQTYLNANKPQAQKLGAQASQVIQDSSDKARSSLGNLNQVFGQRVDAQKIVDDGSVGALGQGAEKLTDAQKQNLKSTANASYSGPQELTDLSDEYTKTSQDFSNAQNNINMSGTEEGRQGLVKQINSAPRTAGMNNFDSMLLQSGGGREMLAQASEANKDLTGDMLGSANVDAMGRVAGVKTANDLMKQQARGALSAEQEKLFNQLNQFAKDRTNKEFNQYGDVLGRFKDSQMTEADLQFLGIPIDSVQSGIYGDIANKIDGNELGKDLGGRYNAGNVANTEERARQAALQDLMTGFGDPSKSVAFSDYVGDEDAYNIRQDAVETAKTDFKNYESGSQTVSDIGKRFKLTDTGLAPIIQAGLTEESLKAQLAKYKNGRPIVDGAGIARAQQMKLQAQYDTRKALLEQVQKDKKNSGMLQRLNPGERMRLTNKK